MSTSQGHTCENRKYCCTLQNLSGPWPGLPNFVICRTKLTAVRNTIAEFRENTKPCRKQQNKQIQRKEYLTHRMRIEN